MCIESVVGVGEVRVAAPGDAQALAQRGADPQHAGAVGAAQPLLPGAGVSIAAERVHIDRDGADALGAVEQHRDVEPAELGWRERAADPADVRAGDEPRARADCFGELCKRRFADIHAVQLARGRERAQQARVLLVAGEDLIAAVQLQATDHLGHALAGAGGERDVGCVGAERDGVGGAQLGVQLGAAFEVRRRASLAQLALELARGCLHGARGQRSVGAGVQVRQPLEDGKLGT